MESDGEEIKSKQASKKFLQIANFLLVYYKTINIELDLKMLINTLL